MPARSTAELDHRVASAQRAEDEPGLSFLVGAQNVFARAKAEEAVPRPSAVIGVLSATS